MDPVRAARSMSIRTDRGSVRKQNVKRIHERISVNVSIQTRRKGSSTCSATAMTDRTTVSDNCTDLGLKFVSVESLRTVPTSTMVRMSLITCSFSAACLLSRRSDLKNELCFSRTVLYNAHLRIYQSNTPPSLCTVSASTKA